jgi:hypothetical protein
MPTFSSNPQERVAEERCVADVTRYGLHVMRVAGEDDSPDFAYTVGMVRTFGHPEVIILGLRLDTMHRILNHVADEVRAGRHFAAGDVTDAFLEGYDVAFRTVPDRHYRPYLGWASWFNEGTGYPALQLVYPDGDHRWPWDDGVADGFRAHQPLLESEPVPAWAR